MARPYRITTPLAAAGYIGGFIAALIDRSLFGVPLWFSALIGIPLCTLVAWWTINPPRNDRQDT